MLDIEISNNVPSIKNLMKSSFLKSVGQFCDNSIDSNYYIIIEFATVKTLRMPIKLVKERTSRMVLFRTISKKIKIKLGSFHQFICGCSQNEF